MISDLWTYLTDGSHWASGGLTDGLLTNIADHLLYTVIALVIAAVIAIPAGLAIGHTGRGATLVVGTVNASRALPTLGLLVLLFIVVSPWFTTRTDWVYLLPVEVVLVLLAIPPLLSGTYSGVQSVDPAVRDAARGMGMTGRQVLLRAELPNAYPLIMAGLRSATLQVIATATVGAYIGLGGLGRPILDGSRLGPFQDNPTSQQATGQLLTGALLVAVLALVVDLILATIQRLTTSRGITGRYLRSQPPPTAPAVGAAAHDVDLSTDEPFSPRTRRTDTGSVTEGESR